ncbi:hypothetical protein NE237_024691 [Protea cynaroides]|uniref:Uncharacterized protein n=1 Tax=Protea cynaroides TaxID=273540 RepID=A0A9Q0H3U1_9MAGN|nr:hypothetical protein NE237_024691 [Protea cynaroides]
MIERLVTTLNQGLDRVHGVRVLQLPPHGYTNDVNHFEESLVDRHEMDELEAVEVSGGDVVLEERKRLSFFPPFEEEAIKSIIHIEIWNEEGLALDDKWGYPFSDVLCNRINMQSNPGIMASGEQQQQPPNERKKGSCIEGLGIKEEVDGENQRNSTMERLDKQRDQERWEEHNLGSC